MMALSFKEIESISTEELKAQYDKHAVYTSVGTQFFLDEIRGREQAEINQQMLRLTNRIYWFTIIVTVATVINLLLFGFLSFPAISTQIEAVMAVPHLTN